MSYFIPTSSSPTALNDNGYSSAFPPLQAFPWAFTSHKKPHNNTTPSSTITSNSSSSSNNSNTSSPLCFFAPLAPPKYPSYLKHTIYANLALEQYNNLKSKRTHYNNNPNDDIDLRLPQFWNKNIKSRHLEVGLNGYDLSYIQTAGPGKKDMVCCAPCTSAAIRTNFPMKPQCGIYYFEIRVLQKGQDGQFAIGFCRNNNKTDKLPGCDSHSYGYHGQSGQLYQHAGHGINYGPTYSSGDIIGCGVHFATKSAFFTKNGVSLGSAFETCIDTSESLYPCIGLSTLGEKITANFGQEPFAFNIVQYVKDQQSITTKLINAEIQPQEPQEKYKKDTKSDIDQLVLSYLLHQGYTQAAQALMKNIQYTKEQDHSSRQEFALNDEQHDRNSIRKALMAGSVDSAMEQTRNVYPGLLENNQDLLFQLKTRKFLEILINNNPSSSALYVSDHSSDTDDDTSSSYSGRSRALSFSTGSIHDLHNQILYEDEAQVHVEKNHASMKSSTFGHYNPPFASPLPVAASGRRLSWAAIAASPTPSFDASVVEEMFTTTISTAGGSRRKSFCGPTRTRRDSMSSMDYSSHEDEEELKRMSIIRKAMNYGHHLQEEYQSNPKHLNKLMELFTLLAYSDPRNSPMAHLLDTCHRDTLASDLNSAIQVYQGCSEDSTLELLYKQTTVASKELAISGHGKASLVHFQDYFKH